MELTMVKKFKFKFRYLFRALGTSKKLFSNHFHFWISVCVPSFSAEMHQDACWWCSHATWSFTSIVICHRVLSMGLMSLARVKHMGAQTLSFERYSPYTSEQHDLSYAINFNTVSNNCCLFTWSFVKFHWIWVWVLPPTISAISMSFEHRLYANWLTRLFTYDWFQHTALSTFKGLLSRTCINHFIKRIKNASKFILIFI